MSEYKISAWTGAAGVLWVVGFGLIATSLLVDIRPAVGQFGLYLTGGAMTMNMRSFFCRFLQRETAAFNWGVEAGRSGSMRAVD